MAYSSGKKTGMMSHTPRSMGKPTNMTGAKVGYSAGKSSGIARSGDKDGVKPMKGC